MCTAAMFTVSASLPLQAETGKAIHALGIDAPIGSLPAGFDRPPRPLFDRI
jgi:hypothetical protein